MAPASQPPLTSVAGAWLLAADALRGAVPEGTPVVLFGVSGMLVVTLEGLTFVTTLDRATELRPLLDALPDEIRHVQRQRGSTAPE